jgi:hypothetical protein
VQVFFANVVESADDAALENVREAFNRIGVDRADNVLPPRMVNGGVRIGLTEPVGRISDSVIRRYADEREAGYAPLTRPTACEDYGASIK